MKRTVAALLVAVLTVSIAAAPATRPVVARTFQVTDLPLKKATGDTKLIERLKPFDRPPETFECSILRINDEADLTLDQVIFPSPLQSPWPENNTVPGELYLPKHVTGKVPAVIVLDILDGSAILPRSMARGFAEQGVAAFYFPMACFSARRPKGNAHLIAFQADPSKAIDNMRQTVLDVRRGKAILASLPQVDADRISITGISMGGIMTALAAGVDGEFDRVVPILAGGDLAAITFHARETRIMRTAMEAKGITQESAEDLLGPVDPLSFASRIDASRCLMINATVDEVIPRATTDALRLAIGSPAILWAPAGHYSSIFFLPNIRQRAIDFVQGKKVDRLQF
jgi:dienelactone hydrolase